MSNYLSSYPNSIVATNLKACNYFQLLQVKNAEDEFKRLEKNYKGGDLYADYDLLRHNLCVFRGGENALQV
jgi:intraflagellar transport protein 56